MLFPYLYIVLYIPLACLVHQACGKSLWGVISQNWRKYGPQPRITLWSNSPWIASLILLCCCFSTSDLSWPPPSSLPSLSPTLSSIPSSLSQPFLSTFWDSMSFISRAGNGSPQLWQNGPHCIMNVRKQSGRKVGCLRKLWITVLTMLWQVTHCNEGIWTLGRAFFFYFFWRFCPLKFNLLQKKVHH